MSMSAVLFVRAARKPQTPQLTLLPIDKLVLSTIATYLSLDKTRTAWPSIRTLANDCWASERRVQRSLSRLEKAKLLHRDTGGGIRTTTYRIAGFSPSPGAPDTDPPPVSPVTPAPVIRDTHPPSPVTPPYKEETTCESTWKGEVQKPNPPPNTLASQVVNELSLPDVPSLLKTVERSISAEAKYRQIEPVAAARLISDWCSEAQGRGVPVNRFAFEDMIWRNDGSRKVSACEDRFMHNRRVIEAVFGQGISDHLFNYQAQPRSGGVDGVRADLDRGRVATTRGNSMGISTLA